MPVVYVTKETQAGEARVATIPESVKGLVKLGLDVQVERGAGEQAGFPDADYAEAGAEIVAESARGSADLVFGIQVPGPRN